MGFDYSKLLGKMREKNITQEKLAKELNLQAPTLSQKINNKAHFKQSEIFKIIKLLNIDSNEIGEYFFIQKV